MLEPKSLLRFCCRFVLVYGLLLVPWPGLDEAYGRLFRGAGGVIFSRLGSRHLVIFEPNGGDARLPQETKILAANRDLLDAKGYGPTKELVLTTRSMGLLPASLITALILATPISWARRGRAWFWGMLCFHGLVFFTIALWLLQEPDNSSGGLALVALPTFWRAVIDHLLVLLFTRMDMACFVPILIWIIVTFRRQDWFRLVPS